MPGPGGAIRYNLLIREAAIRAFVAGMSYTEIKAKYGIGRTALRYHLRRHDIPKRAPIKPQRGTRAQRELTAPMFLMRKGPPKREIKMSDLPSASRFSDYDRIIAIAQSIQPS